MIVLEQMKMLVNLAKADGNLAEDEKQFIKNIGKAHGFPESSVETLFYESHEIIISEKLSIDQRFDTACDLIRLMMLDKRMYLKEIEYCSDMIQRLGFEKRLIYKLIDVIVTGVNEKAQLEEIRKEAPAFYQS